MLELSCNQQVNKPLFLPSFLSAVAPIYKQHFPLPRSVVSDSVPSQLLSLGFSVSRCLHGKWKCFQQFPSTCFSVCFPLILRFEGKEEQFTLQCGQKFSFFKDFPGATKQQCPLSGWHLSIVSTKLSVFPGSGTTLMHQKLPALLKCKDPKVTFTFGRVCILAIGLLWLFSNQKCRMTDLQTSMAFHVSYFRKLGFD